MVIAAGLLAGMPLLDWYRVESPTGAVGASGLAAGGELWLVPVVACAVAAAGAALLAADDAARPTTARWAGPVAAAGAALILVATLRVGVAPELDLIAAGHRVDGVVAAALERRAVVAWSAVVAMLLCAQGVVLTLLAWRP